MKRVLIASGEYGPERIDPGYLSTIYVAVAKRKLGVIRKGAIIWGLWDL